ncbi:MAG: hypothetical protein GX357_01415 [Firmicutes bacterium]|nr:hypothetical protein [Bacillota bacterium]
MPNFGRGRSGRDKNSLTPLIFMLAASLMVISASQVVHMEPADRRQVEEDAAYTEELLQQVSIEQRESPEKEIRRENLAFNRGGQRVAQAETYTENNIENKQNKLNNTSQPDATPDALREKKNETEEKNSNLVLSRGGQRVNYRDVYTVEATAYCPGTVESGCPHDENGASVCTGKFNDGFTATGKKAVAGDGSKENPHLVAVDPKIFPLGSQLYLEGYGYAVAQDTGKAIKGLRLDLLFPDHQSALKFGRRQLKVYYLRQ